MKKISLLFIVIFCLFLTACGEKEEKAVKELSDFSVISSNLGFTVSSNMESYSSVDYITDAMIANLDDVSIEMVIYDDEKNAIKAQDNQIDVFNNMKGSGANVENDKGKNYHKYTMITNGYYMVSSRVDNTLVFSRIPVGSKDNIENILEELGY